MSVVKINAIEVPDGGGPELERRFAARLGAIDGTAGFLGFELLRPVSGDARWFVYTRWETDEAFAAWTEGSGRAAHSGERARPVGTGSALLEFEVVQSVGPAAAPVDGPGDHQGPDHQDPHDQDPHDQDPHDRGPHDQGPHDQDPHDQDPHDRGPHDQGPHDQGPTGRHDADPTTSGSADTAGASVGVI